MSSSAAPSAHNSILRSNASSIVEALQPLNSPQRQWPKYLSAAVSLLLLGSISNELFKGGLTALGSAIPRSLGFYLCFAAVYMVQPVADYIIFRKLWQMPFSGMRPILRKFVANEVLLGYSGEAYFYAWARERLQFVTAPFAAIKDVSILSAVVGNLLTLLLLIVATPFAFAIIPQNMVWPIASSAGVIIAMSLAILLFKGRLFSIASFELRWVAAVHVVRTSAYTLLLALSWHFALPHVPLTIWLLLITGRQLVSRLPLVPNKDLVFAGLALLLIGGDNQVAQLMSFTVALTLLFHALVFVGTSLPSLGENQL